VTTTESGQDSCVGLETFISNYDQNGFALSSVSEAKFPVPTDGSLITFSHSDITSTITAIQEICDD
jgi:hypothetical protein